MLRGPCNVHGLWPYANRFAIVVPFASATFFATFTFATKLFAFATFFATSATFFKSLPSRLPVPVRLQHRLVRHLFCILSLAFGFLLGL